MVSWIQDRFRGGLNRALRLMQISRSLHYYRSRRNDPAGMLMRIRELDQARRRFDCRRLHILPRQKTLRGNKTTFTGR